MNTGRSALAVALIALGFSVCLRVSAAHADVRDLGTVCITLSYDNVGFPPLTHRFGALAYGSRQQYVVLIGEQGAPLQQGSAQVTTDTVIVTFSSSNASGDTFQTSTTQMLLSAATLRGPVITTTVQLLPSLGGSKLAGTATAFACN